MIRFLRFLLAYWWQVILLFIGLCLQVWSSLQLPDMMSQIVNRGIVDGDQDFIMTEGLLMLGVALIGGVGMVVSGFFAARVGAGLARDVRTAVFAKIMNYSIIEISKFTTSSLVTRSTNDVYQVQMVTTMTLRMGCQAPIMGIGAILKAIDTAPEMTWIIAMAVGSLFTIIATVFVFALPKFNMLQKLLDKLSQVTRESLTGLRVVRAFNNQKYEGDKFQKANSELTRVNLFVMRLMSIIFPLVQLILNVTTLLVIWLGAKYVDEGAIEIGNLIAFMQYAMQVMMSFMFLAMIFILAPRGVISWKRISEVLAVESAIKPADSPQKPKKNLHGIVEFRNVSFAYPDAEDSVLKDISFTAHPGQTTAFIGSTGSGKSTLINLIPRFYDVTAGAVLVDGVDVRQVEKDDLMKRIGYVPQRGVLFSGTISSNIAFGGRSDDKKIRAAARTAQASEFINKLEKKFKSPIAQGGDNVSGGQKQRLSIARALYKSPEIYIFDDSFSALDFRTDRNLRTALAKVTHDAAILIVAQRVSTIKTADQIVVLDDGHVAGIGDHYELLRSCKVYKEIAASQFSDDEMRIEMKRAKEQNEQ